MITERAASNPKAALHHGFSLPRFQVKRPSPEKVSQGSTESRPTSEGTPRKKFGFANQ
jgi:hypothetical protein